MNTKHSPLIRLQAARRAYDSALSNCAHWDYESDEHGADHPCCHELESARVELDRAKKAVIKTVI